MPQIPPLSLYIHLPWCVRKCPYCDFNSHKATNETPRGRYIDALLTDMQVEARRVAGREIVSVFLGGGTPSLFTAAEIGALLNGVARHFSLAADSEVTLEANPGTIDCGDMQGYREAGVNRLSIGAQSFSAESLAALGRIHGVADIERSFSQARAAGFGNINLDVMYALPGQTAEDALEDVQQAINLRPEHISWYELTLEPNTVFHARPPAGLPDEDQAYDMQRRGQELLTGSGYERYEISAYARPGAQCRHNLNYWRFGDYVAIGAGAHGKLSSLQEIGRYSKPANPLQYMETMESGQGAGELKVLDEGDRVFEFMLNALRLTETFDEAQFASRTGLQATALRARLEELRDKRLLDELGNGVWRVSPLGQRFVNDLQAAFLP
jgi:oxygen-independent coproporphyrinogen-3 oxidase